MLAPFQNEPLSDFSDLDRAAVIQPKSGQVWPAKLSGAELAELCLRWVG